jgi:hypothetical protein
MKKQLLFLATLSLGIFINSHSETKKTENKKTENYLIIKFKFDSTQIRLDNKGNTAILPKENAGLTPKFNFISSHYYELSPNARTQFGKGVILFRAPEVTTGGDTAINFVQSHVVKEGGIALKFPLDKIQPQLYEYIRVSLAYQNFDIKLRHQNINLNGTLAAFIGFNTYIKSFKVKDSIITLNQNKKQGFWVFESKYKVRQGQAQRVTVPNLLHASSPVPAGSCVVTGKFLKPLLITGNETKDITITVSLSINKSFEWKEINKNGIYEPLLGEKVVDMGIRGLIPIVE